MAPQIRHSWPVDSQSARWSRIWFAVTALCAAAGVALSVYTAVQTPGHFPSGAERGFNTFAFFTVQSNLIAGGTALLLAIRLDRPSLVFRTFRLIGLVAITVTGVVFHVALARLLDLDGLDQLGNQLVHTVVPVLTVVGWLIFGPRGATSRRVAWLSLIFPACWLAFTLIRGAVIDWYPYPFHRRLGHRLRQGRPERVLGVAPAAGPGRRRDRPGLPSRPAAPGRRSHPGRVQAGR
jgi:hypothetical protein